MTTRRKFTPEFKAQVVLEMLTEQKSAAQASLERLQPNQPIDRHVGPGWVINIENRKGLFVDAPEEVMIEILCPGVG